ncbi:TNF receptor-associated factor 3-like [Ambystoma mexicanum]|uniref:TNF receptor-associated factor 3-like n=1 Tax=Ambystoma mexicanum TaxID=8296 RepID=UPI0037E9B441
MVALASPPRPLNIAPSSGLQCSACGFLLIRPKQTECGHRYCATCVQGLFRKEEEVNCLVCQERLTQKKFHNDRAAENDTLATEVKCPHTGCGWQGLLKVYLGTHQQECSFVPEPCPNATFGCGFVGAQKGMKMHLLEECQWRMVPCPRCSSSVSLTLLKDHVCSPIEKRDISLCGPLNTMKTELLSGSCSMISEHPRLSLQCLTETAENQGKSNKATLSSHTKEANEPHLMTLLSEVYNLHSRLDRQEAVNTTFKQLVMDKMVSLTGLVSKATNGESADACHQQQRDPRVEGLEKMVVALGLDLQKQLAAMEALQHKCLEYEKVIQGLQSSRGSHAPGSQEPVSSNGILVWKIENVSSLLRTARAEQRTSYYSRAFCTHPFGYRLCCRLYPNGDGSGKGTHVSLFLVLMRGDYDDVLRWPFRQKVTFLVLDQTQQQKPFRESFVPDILSASFHKPKSHMNVASGSPQFLKHSQLLASTSPYLKNDTIYIKVAIDPSGLEV